MKVPIFSDVHANWAALRAVLAAETDTEKVLCLGDLVAYRPQPVERVEWAMKNGVAGWLLYVQLLIGSASQRFRETAKDMHGSATRRAVARRDLTNTDEEYAALRAINHLVGSSRQSIPLSGKQEI